MKKSTLFTLSAAIFLGALQAAPAEEAELREVVRELEAARASNSIKASTVNEKGTVTYNDKEVWKGKVKKSLTTIAKSVNGKDLAAAWDGKKLIWENQKGAGAALKPDLKKALKRQEELKKALPIPPA